MSRCGIGFLLVCRSLARLRWGSSSSTHLGCGRSSMRLARAPVQRVRQSHRDVLTQARQRRRVMNSSCTLRALSKLKGRSWLTRQIPRQYSCRPSSILVDRVRAGAARQGRTSRVSVGRFPLLMASPIRRYRQAPSETKRGRGRVFLSELPPSGDGLYTRRMSRPRGSTLLRDPGPHWWAGRSMDVGSSLSAIRTPGRWATLE